MVLFWPKKPTKFCFKLLVGGGVTYLWSLILFRFIEICSFQGVWIDAVTKLILFYFKALSLSCWAKYFSIMICHDLNLFGLKELLCLLWFLIGSCWFVNMFVLASVHSILLKIVKTYATPSFSILPCPCRHVHLILYVLCVFFIFFLLHHYYCMCSLFEMFYFLMWFIWVGFVFHRYFVIYLIFI